MHDHYHPIVLGGRYVNQRGNQTKDMRTLASKVKKKLHAFLTIQWKKTIDNPTRIYMIPTNLFWHLFGRSIWNLIALSWRVVSLTFGSQTQIRSSLFDEAVEHFHRNQPKQTWEIFQRLLPDSLDPHHFFVAGACLVQGLGRRTDAVAHFARANELRWNAAKNMNVATDQFRVLDNFWSAHLGHTATLDYVIKLGLLEGRAPQDTILYVPSGSTIANRFLLNQFRPLLRLVERPEDLPIPEPAVDALQFTFLGPRLPDGSTRFLWEVAAETYRKWNAKSRKPLLSLPPEIDERGRAALATVGMPRDAWFVALHVRESGSNFAYRGVHNVLNARIADFLPAISEITGRGGWVIRMGDPSMAPLSPIPNVIDYPHSQLRCDWMDVFIATKCRFFVGTSSGPAYVPPAYGIRSVLTNWWPPAQRPWHLGDIFIPKVYRSYSDLHRLTLAETLVEPFAWCNSTKYIEEQYSAIVEDSFPEDILAAVVEMLESLDGTAEYDARDLGLRKLANDLFESRGAYGMANLARGFLRQHDYYLR